MSAKKRTAKQRVLIEYPKAVSKEWWLNGEAQWLIERDSCFDKPPLGKGQTSKIAWANAAKKLP